jgi:hypothetical protein
MVHSTIAGPGTGYCDCMGSDAMTADATTPETRDSDQAAASELTVWTALDAPWFYLGRPLEGVLDLVLLAGPDGPVAPAFTAPAAAGPFLRRAPRGVRLLEIAEDDHRAKEEWLRVASREGAATLAFDPDPLTLEPSAEMPTEQALWYIVSHRTATACL